jgi:hypothetical protein
MTESTEGAFCLRAAADDGVHPVLTGVQAQGRLDGLLFSLTLRQRVRVQPPAPGYSGYPGRCSRSRKYRQ